MLLITFFTLLLNVIAVLLIYYCLENMDKKDKIIFIGVTVAVVYMLTSFVYWISTNGVEYEEVSELGQNFLVFLFVPVNGIIVLPLLAKSYRKYKVGSLKSDKFRNRVIVLSVVLLILLILECSYFKDIQNSVVEMVKANKQNEEERSVEVNKNDLDPNLDLNEIAINGITVDTNMIN